MVEAKQIIISICRLRFVFLSLLTQHPKRAPLCLSVCLSVCLCLCLCLSLSSNLSSEVRVPAGARGKCSSPGSTFCADFIGRQSPTRQSRTVTVYSVTKTTKAVIKISVVRTEITINILSTTADNHYSYCRQQEPMVGEGEGGRGRGEGRERKGESGEGEGRDKEREGEIRRKMGRESK